MATDTQQYCYHCGEAIRNREARSIEVHGETKPLCCTGCEAVCSLIVKNGLSNFYNFRRSPTSNRLIDKTSHSDYLEYDANNILQNIATLLADETYEATFVLENIYCGACVWLIENTVKPMPGVEKVTINPSSHRMHLAWDQRQTKLSQILSTIADLGYISHPMEQQQQENLRLKEKRKAIKRLAVAGIGMMQVMMFAVGLYTGVFESMQASTRDLLRLFSLLVATPVVLYSAQPFFISAFRALNKLSVNMDVPIALAIASAYSASIWATFSGDGEVYFDSVCMFTFFLLTGRYLEMMARHSIIYQQDAISHILPISCTRIENNKTVLRNLKDIKTYDILLVKTGEVIPCDGIILKGTSTFDESIISGESLPQNKHCGQAVIAGSINLGECIQIKITRTGKQTTLAHIQRLLDRAQSQKPKLVQMADRVASKFVFAVLLIATVTGLIWWQIDPAAAFPIMLAVLVVTCPCALSLATPVALTATINRLAKNGLLIVQSNAIEKFNQVTHIVFDKTGTLTLGQIRLDKTIAISSISAEQCLQIASALEQHSNHPLATAFKDIQTSPNMEVTTPCTAQDVKTFPGFGLQGNILNHQYRIGSLSFVSEPFKHENHFIPDIDSGSISVFLADNTKVLAQFICNDQLRHESSALIQQLKSMNINISIASGDHPKTVKHIAGQLGVDHYQGHMSPDDKLSFIQQLQQTDIVAMVGDGINDAPVLSAADVSIAMNSGTALAQSHADMILLDNHLIKLLHAFKLGGFSLHIIKQNISWAILYNLSAIPLAASGLISAWMAALGMSLSSLLVVFNATRIKRFKENKFTRKKHMNIKTQSATQLNRTARLWK